MMGRSAWICIFFMLTEKGVVRRRDLKRQTEETHEHKMSIPSPTHYQCCRSRCQVRHPGRHPASHSKERRGCKGEPHALSREPVRKLLHEHDRPVAPGGAADGYCAIAVLKVELIRDELRLVPKEAESEKNGGSAPHFPKMLPR